MSDHAHHWGWMSTMSVGLDVRRCMDCGMVIPEVRRYDDGRTTLIEVPRLARVLRRLGSEAGARQIAEAYEKSLERSGR